VWLTTIVDGKDKSYYVRQVLKTLGFADFDITNGDLIELTGSKARIELVHQEYKGEFRAMVNQVLPWKEKLPTLPVFSADFDDRDGIPITALIRYTKDGLIIRGFRFRSGVQVNETIVRVRKMLLVLKRFLAHLEQEEISEE
jgi:hypothetical protein